MPISDKQASKAINEMIVNDEGGWVYTDHPADPDQGTYAGVRFKTFKKWLIQNGVDIGESYTPQEYYDDTINDASEALAEEILELYYVKYYLAAKCDQVAFRLRRPMLSCAVNIGPREAIRALQRAFNRVGYNLETDGIFGKYTSSANMISGGTTVNYFLDEWMRYYIWIIESDADAGKFHRIEFLEGWLNRVTRYRYRG